LSGAWESADPVFRPDTFMLLSYLEKSPSRRRISPSGADTPRWGTTITFSTDASIRTSPSEQGSVSHLATVDQTEVCPLSRGVMSQPLSGPLPPGIRFFRRPIPAQSTAFLTVRLPAKPHWQPYGLTTFPICHTTGLGSAYSPVAFATTYRDTQARQLTTYLLVSAYQQLWHLLLTTFISSSHTLPIPASLAPYPNAARSFYTAVSRPPHTRKIGGYIVRRASHLAVTHDACLHRLPLVVQRVHCLGTLRSNNDKSSFRSNINKPRVESTGNCKHQSAR